MAAAAGPLPLMRAAVSSWAVGRLGSRDTMGKAEEETASGKLSMELTLGRDLGRRGMMASISEASDIDSSSSTLLMWTSFAELYSSVLLQLGKKRKPRR